MFGAFVAFGLPSSLVLASVLAYRAIAYLLPIPPGVIAYLQLRRTVTFWEEQDREQARARRTSAGPPPTRLTGRLSAEPELDRDAASRRYTSKSKVTRGEVTEDP